ncbi:MAG: hypothetical protein JNK55_20295 [Rubrivivax sp.]|nr:hypothetical protein [Rubrivivax sp.]
MSDEMVCTNCGHVGETKTLTKGHIAIELILWLCFLIPGIIYSVWRHASRVEVCPVCGNDKLLPKAAPMAQKFLRENLPETLKPKQQQAIRPPSSGAVSMGRMLGRLFSKK